MNGLLNKNELAANILLKGEAQASLLEAARRTRNRHIGDKCYLRGLIELSNRCRKNCLYCGIRRGNGRTERYTLTDEEVLFAAEYAYVNGYGSIAIQAGENNSSAFAARIERLLEMIGIKFGNELGVTLSLGEQSADTYRRWFEAGASRYLLRIESSSRALYEKIHPADGKHLFDRRLQALYDLKEAGYQVGTGVMIGLPFQTPEDLAEDLIFMKTFDIDMCGMGPYLEHRQTPLYRPYAGIPSPEDRFSMSLNMIAQLRLLMPKINIAATTALQSIDYMGREKALQAGANVVMPNITPLSVRASYKLYENKPLSEEGIESQNKSLIDRIDKSGCRTALWESGTSAHFKEKRMKR